MRQQGADYRRCPACWSRPASARLGTGDFPPYSGHSLAEARPAPSDSRALRLARPPTRAPSDSRALRLARPPTRAPSDSRARSNRLDHRRASFGVVHRSNAGV